MSDTSSDHGNPDATASRPSDSVPANQPGKSDGKDFWDKFSTLSTLLSTLLIAAVGGYVSHRFEERQAEEQKRIQETQAVAQLMDYLTNTDQQKRRTAFIAIKALGDAKLMVDLASSDPKSAGAREALRDVEFHATEKSDRDLAISLLSQFEFAPSCTLPFQPVALNHPIDFSDQSCGMYGDSTSDPLKAQDRAKNNFCAGTDFRDVSLVDFSNLQQKADARTPSGNAAQLPQDRTVLKNLSDGLGEGSAVRFTGYIMNAHYSDIASGEAVNCHVPGNEMNDIHINLVAKPDESDSCQSITAEVSPHMRPAKWEANSLASLAENKTLVRIGGQLMFDASHRACSGDSKPLPRRLSTWEIHPVYSIEICSSPRQNTCPEDQWVPLALPPTQ